MTNNVVSVNDKLFKKAMKAFPVVDICEMDTIEFTILKTQNEEVYDLGITFYSVISESGNEGFTLATGINAYSIEEMVDRIGSLLASGIFEGSHNLSCIASLFEENSETLQDVNLEELFIELGYSVV